MIIISNKMRGTLLVSSLLCAHILNAAPFVQCPATAQLLTQNITHGSCKTGNTNVPCSFNPQNPSLSTDKGCQDPSSPTFEHDCQVLIDPITGQPSGATTDPNVVCRSITCGDGHVRMADGNDIFIFGFNDVTGIPQSNIMTRVNQGNYLGIYVGSAQASAPTMFATEGQSLYLTLTNGGFRERPDLFDPHTVHYHGFPNAASFFDGEPMASLSIGVGESLTYYYLNQYAGTYMWHCHREAAEHMQMGMLGQLYIKPRQDNLCQASYATFTSTPQCFNSTGTHRWSGFAYSDGDGTTGYDKMYFLQETAFDPLFHNADHSYQPVPFANMHDTYGLFNGRGYPDTVNPGNINSVVRIPTTVAPAGSTCASNPDQGSCQADTSTTSGCLWVPTSAQNKATGSCMDSKSQQSQRIPAIAMDYSSGTGVRRTINHGDRVLIHLSSLSTVDFFTVTILGIPFQVVGQGAQLRRGITGVSTAYATNSVTIGGGESADILLDTTGVTPGTYFMYTTNLNALSNNTEDFGGMMTEIVVN